MHEDATQISTPAMADEDEEILPSGTVIAGRYTLVEHLAAGGMGRVYVATQAPLGRRVALKIMHSDLCSDTDAVQRFFREAVAVSQLTHPNTITIFDYGESEDGNFFIAMEYLEGEPLSARISRDGPMHPEAAISIVLQVAKSLSEAHRKNIVHRDLKPENVFLGTVEKDLVKVLDFGIAKILEPEEPGTKLTRTGFVCGTPEYMSPEQARGEDLDGRSDLYALGVLLYEILTAVCPFEESTPLATVLAHQNKQPPELPSSVPLHIAEFIVHRALSKSPDDRPDDADMFASELEVAAMQSGLLLDTTGSVNVVEMRRALSGNSGEQPLPELVRNATPMEVAEVQAMTASNNTRNKLILAVVVVFSVVGLLVILVAQSASDDDAAAAESSGSSSSEGEGGKASDKEGSNTAKNKGSGSPLGMLAEGSEGTADAPAITIRFTTPQEGVFLYFDDPEKDAVPLPHELDATGLAGERLTFTFEKEGYAELTRVVAVPELGEEPVTIATDVELAALVEVAFTSAPSGAAVHIDGEEIGTTPTTQTLAPGTSIDVSFELDGYDTIDKELVIEDGEKVHVALEKAPSNAPVLTARERKKRREKRQRERRRREREKKKKDAKKDDSGGSDYVPF